MGGLPDAPVPLPVRQRITLERARALRRNQTGPEKALWEYLRSREFMGAKFRRQHPFGPYILDFFCVEHRLAVEVDGQTHSMPGGPEGDRERESWIESQGVRVLRFSNDLVIANAEGVAMKIRAVLSGGVDAVGRLTSVAR